MIEKEILIKLKYNPDGSITHEITFDKTVTIFAALQAFGTLTEMLSKAIFNKYPKQTNMSTKRLNEFLNTKILEDLV